MLAAPLALGACKTTTPDAREALAPCARARLAREFPKTPVFSGCYSVVAGPAALSGAGTVVLTELAEDVLDDEPPKYTLATTRPVLTSTPRAPVTTSWEQLSQTRARLFWLKGTKGVEACVEGSGGALEGSVVVVDETPPFAHPAGALRLVRTACPQ